MCININASECYQKQLLLESCSIENWIAPMLFMGHIDEVVWVKAEWCDQIASGTYEMMFGDYKGRVKTSCTLDYFLTDGCFETEDLLSNKKLVKLHVSEMKKDFNEIVEKSDKDLILDIDLDFFSTHNPFLGIYPKADTYRKLEKIFHMEKNYTPHDLKSVVKFVKLRNEQMDFFERVFKHLHTTKGSLEKFPNENHQFADQMILIQELVESLIVNYNKDEVEWAMLFDAGCTCDDVALPHHETTIEELKILFVNFEASLRTLPKTPTIITICKYRKTKKILKCFLK